MPPPINPLNPPPQDERNLRKLVTEGLGVGEEVQLGNILRRGGKRGPAGSEATFRGKIRPDQPGLRYNLLLIADDDRGGQPRFVNLDALRWVKARNRMARPWGDPAASHNTIPREERRYAKDALYTTSGGNTGVRHFFPPGYGPLDDESAPESRRPPQPISELRGEAGRDRFNRWLAAGGVGLRTRDFSEGPKMITNFAERSGVNFAAPDRGMLNDGGPWSHGRFAPKGFAGRMADSLGVSLVPLGAPPPQEMQGGGMSYSMAGVGDRSAGALNHFMPGLRRMPGKRQSFGFGGQSFGIRSIPPTADAYLDRLAAWRKPGGDVEPPDMPEREERESVLDSHPADYDETRVMTKQGVYDALSRAGKLPDYQRLKARLGRVPHGGLDYDPSEMSDRVPTDAEKREIVGPDVWDTRLVKAGGGKDPYKDSLARTGGPLQDYELEREDNIAGRFSPRPISLERHWLKYPNYPAQQEPRVNVPGSSTDLRTRLLEMELNDPSVPHDLLALYRRELAEKSPSENNDETVIKNAVGESASKLNTALHNLPSDDLNSVQNQFPSGRYGSLDDHMKYYRNIARHRFSRGSQDFSIQPRPQLGALGNTSLVPILLPQGSAPALGVTPTGGFSPPPRNAALVPQRRFALGEQEFSNPENVPDSLDDLIASLGQEHQQRVDDIPMMLDPNTPEELMRLRATTKIGRSVKSLYDMDPVAISNMLRTRRVLGAAMKPQQRAKMVLGSSGTIDQQRAHDIANEQPVKLPEPTQPYESPADRRRRMSGGSIPFSLMSQQEFDDRSSRPSIDAPGQLSAPRPVYRVGPVQRRPIDRPRQLYSPSQPIKRQAPGRDDALLENFNRLAQQRSASNRGNRISGYLGGDVLAGELPGNVRLGQPPLRDEPVRPFDVPAESMRQPLREVAPQRNRQLQGRSRMTMQQIAEMAARGYGLATNPGDAGLVREHQIEERLTPRPGAPRSASTRSDDGAAGMAQLNAALRPRQRSWGDWWNGLNDSLERGLGNLAESGRNWIWNKANAVNDRLNKWAGVDQAPVAQPKEPIPLSTVKARTWLQEAEKHRNEYKPDMSEWLAVRDKFRPRGPRGLPKRYRSLDDALELASQAENDRPGGRRFELDEMIPQSPQNFGRLMSGAGLGGAMESWARQLGQQNPAMRKRLVGFSRGEQDFGMWDNIKHLGSMVNPVSNYRNLREGGHGRLASGAIVGAGLLGDALTTGFHPPLVSMGVGRYAQRKAQAADRASDQRRAEWMQG